MHPKTYQMFATFAEQSSNDKCLKHLPLLSIMQKGCHSGVVDTLSAVVIFLKWLLMQNMKSGCQKINLGFWTGGFPTTLMHDNCEMQHMPHNPIFRFSPYTMRLMTNPRARFSEISPWGQLYIIGTGGKFQVVHFELPLGLLTEKWALGLVKSLAM